MDTQNGVRTLARYLIQSAHDGKGQLVIVEEGRCGVLSGPYRSHFEARLALVKTYTATLTADDLNDATQYVTVYSNGAPIATIQRRSYHDKTGPAWKASATDGTEIARFRVFGMPYAHVKKTLLLRIAKSLAGVR